MAAALLHYAARYAHGLPATLDIALPQAPPTTTEELRHIEATHQVGLELRALLLSPLLWPWPLYILGCNLVLKRCALYL